MNRKIGKESAFVKSRFLWKHPEWPFGSCTCHDVTANWPMRLREMVLVIKHSHLPRTWLWPGGTILSGNSQPHSGSIPFSCLAVVLLFVVHGYITCIAGKVLRSCIVDVAFVLRWSIWVYGSVFLVLCSLLRVLQCKTKVFAVLSCRFWVYFALKYMCVVVCFWLYVLFLL